MHILKVYCTYYDNWKIQYALDPHFGAIGKSLLQPTKVN